ncbi:uncharacterized protein K441DRAFT_669479 [Cenococcum geophilum 1.58]|uniref:Uncharacterized protein n=1 Tax=Cenococcum geophilum 1.58 TaxID=794803 RepID=A0ACC8EPI9_9PEZI|nr:hypothetical protein K441DRAFT_669479 [Cenococcum geophilum 1.58]
MVEILVLGGRAPAVIALSRDELLHKLDGLLERYLNLLDRYQQARLQLSNHLSSGFLSLAQANFSNSSRTRFGQDYYDGRMQASTKIAIQEHDSASSFLISKSPSATRSATQSSNTSRLAKGPASVSIDSETASQSFMHDESPSSWTVKPIDPIRWFGILLPQALRNTQRSFADAVEGPVVNLVTLTKELRSLEIEIGRLRKQIKKT